MTYLLTLKNKFMRLRCSYNKKTNHTYLLFAVILFPYNVYAENEIQNTPIPSSSFFSVQYENDLFTPGNKDHYYTSGIQLTMLNNDEPPTWLTNIAKWLPFSD